MSKELIEQARLFGRISDLATYELCQRLADRIEELERERDTAWRKLNEQADKTVDRAEQERDALQADNARLREALGYALQAWQYDGISEEHGSIALEVESRLAATPEQSLARPRNQALDK